MGWKSTMRRARKLHRPSLKDWECDGLYESFPSFVDSLSDQYMSFIPSDRNGRNYNIPTDLPLVLDGRYLSVEEFNAKYEKNTPCVIKGIPYGYDGGEQVEEWHAVRKWSLSALAENPDLRHCKFKCGEDDDEKSIKVRLKDFLKYMEKNCDDSPLYVFDTSFEDDCYAKVLLSHYRVPSYFRDDLFRFVSETRRPPYRWWLIGPERSGTCVHFDPLSTSAWNTLIYGKKRWVLFPPHVPKRVVKGRGLVRSDEDDEAIHYFMFILPRIKRKASSLRYHEDYKDFACYEFTQNAGETVFIPNGWWHAVLNLTHTVGVTQNFCSPRNFDNVWLKTRTGRKRLAWKWLCQLDKHYPHLAERARRMNERDGFRMKYDPAEIKRREQQERRRKLQRVV